MTEPQRHNAILDLLQRQGQISVADVIDQFDIELPEDLFVRWQGSR